MIAESIGDYFQPPGFCAFVRRLKEAGVDTAVKREKSGDSLAGLTFVITGTLAGMKRDEAAALITANGGKSRRRFLPKRAIFSAAVMPEASLPKPKSSVCRSLVRTSCTC